MEMLEAIKCLEGKVLTPKKGLPEEIFLFISRLTPMVNVDLLIKDERRRTLLSWRDDRFSGTGWHLPGGIVRFKETFEKRLSKVAEIEIGAKIKFDPAPIAINQIFCKQNSRGHFVSLLYKCYLSSKYIPSNKGLTCKDRRYLKWHEKCPADLIEIQNIYKKFI